MPALDLLTDANGEFIIRNNDLVVGQADQALIAHLLKTRKGDMSWEPTVGVGVADYLDDDNPLLLRRAARLELERDGVTITKLTVTPAGVEAEGYYHG